MLDPLKLRQLRYRRKLTQSALGELSGMIGVGICKLETPAYPANPKLETVELLAAALGCTVCDLLSEGRYDDRASVDVPAKKIDAATDWLKMKLAGGERPVARLMTMAELAGFDQRLLYRAGKRVKIQHDRNADGAVVWSLPRR